MTAEDVPAQGQVAGGHAARADVGPAQSPEMTAVATSQNPGINQLLIMTVCVSISRGATCHRHLFKNYQSKIYILNGPTDFLARFLHIL